MRHQILPVLERELQPAIVEHLGRLANMAREDESFWMALVGERMAALTRRDGERLGTGRQEERVVPAPDREQRRAMGADVFLEFGIERDVARIVEEQVELNLVHARALGVEGVERPSKRGDSTIASIPAASARSINVAIAPSPAGSSSRAI